MTRRRRIYEGKAKILYEGPEPGTLIQFFKDDATAFNKKKHDVVDGKGVLNNRISEYIFTHLNRIGIPTHFIRRINMREQLIKEVEIIPLEIVVRNIAGSRSRKRLRIEEGTSARGSSIESTTKVRCDSTNRWVFEEQCHSLRAVQCRAGNRRHMALAIRVNDSITRATVPWASASRWSI